MKEPKGVKVMAPQIIAPIHIFFARRESTQTGAEVMVLPTF